jgi:hypothetical protein
MKRGLAKSGQKEKKIGFLLPLATRRRRRCSRVLAGLSVGPKVSSGKSSLTLSHHRCCCGAFRPPAFRLAIAFVDLACGLACWFGLTNFDCPIAFTLWALWIVGRCRSPGSRRGQHATAPRAGREDVKDEQNPLHGGPCCYYNVGVVSLQRPQQDARGRPGPASVRRWLLS